MKSDQQLSEILKPIWNKYQGIYPELKSFEIPVIRFDGRLKVLSYYYQESSIIRVSRLWFPANKDLYISDILPHEIAHLVDAYLNGPIMEGDQHNDNWQAIMLDYGINPQTHYQVK